MPKKVVLIIIIILCLSALVYITLTPGQMGPPPLPTTPGVGDVPRGHPGSNPGQGPIKAPDLTLPDLDGNQVKLSDYRGEVVVINFWSASCAPCLIEMPSFEKLKAMLKGKRFEVLTITSDHKFTAIKTAESLDLTLPVLLDPEQKAALKFGVYATPTTIIVAPDGTIDNRVIGPANWADGSVVDYMNALLKRHPPSEFE